MSTGDPYPPKESHTHWHTGLDEARIREIVREEIGQSASIRVTPQGVGCYPRGTVVYEKSPKPKTDLERAAEIADNYSSWGKHLRNSDEYQRGYMSGFEICGRNVAREIRALLPSPDWRKIAEGLYGAVVDFHHRVGECHVCEAKEAYDAAVKEAEK